MSAINSYIIDIIEALRMFLFWGGAVALLVGAFRFVIAMIISELRRQETSCADLESSLKDIPEGESSVEEFYEFCSAIPKHLALLGVIAILIGALLPSQTTISVWFS